MYPNSILDILAWMMDHRPQRKCEANAYLQINQSINTKNSYTLTNYKNSVLPVSFNYHVLFNLCLVYCDAGVCSLFCQIIPDEMKLQ